MCQGCPNRDLTSEPHSEPTRTSEAGVTAFPAQPGGWGQLGKRANVSDGVPRPCWWQANESAASLSNKHLHHRMFLKFLSTFGKYAVPFR